MRHFEACAWLLRRLWAGGLLCLLALSACGGGGGSSPPVAILQIAEQPTDTSVLEGSPARFAVKALNARSYQWQRLTSGTWQDLPGQQTDALQLPNVALSDTGAQFRVQVRGDVAALISAAASLTVTRKPQPVSILVQPASQLLSEGETLNWSVTATGTDLSYQWQRSRDGLAWTDVPSAKAALWSPGKASLADHGLRVRVLVSNALGSVSSSVASLEVYPAPSLPTFTRQPVDARVQAGQTASFEAQVLGQPAPTLQWQRSSKGSQWEDVPQAQAAAMQLGAVSAADDGSQFRLSASNRAGQVFSQVVRLTVLPPMQALSWQSEPQSLQVGIGQDAVFTAQVAAGAPATLQWQFSRDAGKSWQTLMGANDTRLVIASASSREAGNWYRAQASNEEGQITSRAAQLQLDARLQMRLLLGDGRGRGHRDGPLLDAKMDGFSALAQDASGNLYFADPLSQVVRKVDFAAGRVVTLAGAPYQSGSSDGAGAQARFNQPRAVAVDARKQVFVLDLGNQRIRAISTAGVVSTLVSEPDPVKKQRLDEQSTLAVHPVSGELFYSLGCSIYRVPAAGSPELWTGGACGNYKDGDRRDAVWSRVLDFGIDASGTLVAVDGGLVRRVLPSGQVESLLAWKDMPTALQFKRARRGSDAALYTATSTVYSRSSDSLSTESFGQSLVFATPSDGATASLTWDVATARFVDGDLIAGALSMAALPPKSRQLWAGPIRLVSNRVGSSVWVNSAGDSTLWQVDRDGQASAWADVDGIYPMAILPLTDQVLACRRSRYDSISNELLSIKQGGRVQVLASWKNNDGTADLGFGYCEGLLWDAARGRVFEVATGSASVYDLKTQSLSKASDLGYAIGRQVRLLAVYPDGALLVRERGEASELMRLNADGTTQRLGVKLWASAAVIDQAGVAFLLDSEAGQVHRLKPGGSLELVAGVKGLKSTEPGSEPSWREPFGLHLWGPDQLLVSTPTELTVLDVPSGVDCGCKPPAKAARARKAQLLQRH